MKLKSLWPVAQPRLVRLSSFPVKVSALILLLGGNQRLVDQHVNRGAGMVLQAGRQSAKQPMESVTNLPGFLPKQKRIEVVSLIDALPTDAHGLARSVRVDALLEKLKGGKIRIMSGIYARDLPQLVKKLPSLFVANISQLEINRSHEK